MVQFEVFLGSTILAFDFPYPFPYSVPVKPIFRSSPPQGMITAVIDFILHPPFISARLATKRIRRSLEAQLPSYRILKRFATIRAPAFYKWLVPLQTQNMLAEAYCWLSFLKRYAQFFKALTIVSFKKVVLFVTPPCFIPPQALPFRGAFNRAKFISLAVFWLKLFSTIRAKSEHRTYYSKLCQHSQVVFRMEDAAGR